MKRRNATIPIILLILLAFAMPVLAQSDNWNTVGLRAGVGDARNNESFTQYEAYFAYGLPWQWQSDDHWTLGTFIGVNAGMVKCEGQAFIGSAGPGLYLMTPGKRFVLSGSVSPTYIGRTKFGADDFGASFQFTSAIAVNVNFLDNMTMGYRYQHMSNASISNENPGLNHHMVELGYRF